MLCGVIIMEEYSVIKISEISVRAKSGRELSKCLKECMTMAIQHWNIVKLTHNDSEYVIDPNKMHDSIT